jgi:ABC-type phosphate transport system substrate-binding protein
MTVTLVIFAHGNGASTISLTVVLNKLTNAITNKSVVIFVLICLVAAPGLVQAKQLIVVTDKASTTTNIKAADLAGIFNARIRTWQDGNRITLVMRDPASENGQLILRRVLNMTPGEARTLIQSHPGVVVVADTDEAILRIVSSTRGAIGVIDLYSLTKDVNVVKIDGKLPMDPDYLLKGN